MLKIDLYLHEQGFDTTAPAGKAMFQMPGAFAEFERAIIRERVVAGMTRAKAKARPRAQGAASRLVGRPSIPRAAIRAAYEAGGIGLRAIAAQFGVGVETVRRCVG